MTNEEDISRWVTKSLEQENIRNPTVIVLGSSNVGDNYGGEITFVMARGKCVKGEDCIYHVVVKTGKRDETVRNEMDFKQLYYREVFLYRTVFPQFREFQLKIQSKHVFNVVPKCYKTILEKDVEVIVLENLKQKGFILHDRQMPMNDSHIKLVLWNYAKFHAVSFSMRDQNPEQFNKLRLHLKPFMADIFTKTHFKAIFQETYERNAKLVQNVDPALYAQMTDIFGPRMMDTFIQVCGEIVDDGIIIHGDCWNNNFMFKYENNNQDDAKDVAILDWQVSCVHSPILDLSYFLYSVSSEKELERFDEYLQFYHDSLSQFIQEMGSDPNKLYPYSNLLNQWNKYSIYGITFFISGLQMTICDKEDAPTAIENYEEFKKSMNILSTKNQKKFYARFFPTLRHFCSWNRNIKV